MKRLRRLKEVSTLGDVGKALPAQVVHGCLGGGEEQGCGVVREDAVDFLGHAAIEGA